MPIKEKNEYGLSVGIPANQRDNLTPQEEKPTSSAPSVLEVADAAFRQGNWLTQVVHGESNPYSGQPANKNFDPLSKIEGYEDYADWFSKANSDAEVEWLKRKADRDRSEKDVLARAGGWGTTAEIVASLFTPDIFVGGGAVSKAIKGGKYVKAAAEGATVGALSGGLYGMGQNIRDESREEIDIVKDAALFSVAGSLLNPAFHGAGQLIRGKSSTVTPPAAAANEPTAAAFQQSAQQLKTYVSHVNGTAAPETAIAKDLADDGSAIHYQSAASNAGVAAAPTPPTPSTYTPPTVADTNLVGSFGANKINLNQSAVTLANSSFQEFRAAGQKLFRDLRQRVGNLDGSYTTLQSAESEFERLGNGVLGRGLDDFNKAYDAYIKKGGWETPQTLQYVQQKYGKNKLTRKEFDEEIGIAMSNADRHAIREIERVAQQGRVLVDELANEAVRLGRLDTSGNLKGTALSYFGRSFNREKIINEQFAFRQMLVNEFQRTNQTWTQAQLEQAAQDVYERIIHGDNRRLINISTITQDANGNIIPLGRNSKASVAMERKLEIDDNVLEPYLNKSYRDFMTRYSNTVGTDLALTKMIGDTTGESMINRALAEKQARQAEIAAMAISDAEKSKLVTELEREFDRGVKAIRNGISIMDGSYKVAPDNPRSWATAAHGLATFNYITKMGGAAVSSLSDFTKNLLVFGMGSTLKHAVPAMRQTFGDLFRLPSIKDPAYDAIVQANKRLGVAMETVLRIRHMQINDLVDQYASKNPVIRGLDWAADKMGIMNGLAHLTDIQKQMTGVIANDEILRSVIAETAGNATERELRNLRVWGIDTDMARRIANEFNSGITAGHNMINNGLYVTDTVRWADREAAETLERALTTLAHTVVYNPSAGAKVVTGLSKPMETLLTQFMSFNFGSHIQHFVPMMQQINQRDASVMGYIVSAMVMGAAVWELKDIIRRSGFDGDRGEERERNWQEVAYDAVSESGLATIPFFINNVSSGMGFGDMRRAISDDDRPTMAAQNFNAGVLLGPTGQLGKEVHNIVSDIKNDTEDAGTISSARKLVPFNNLFYLRGLINHGEEWAQDFMGLPDKATTTLTIKNN